MTLQVVVNVMADNLRWNPSKGWYAATFIFQQVAPLSPIVVDKFGNINLPKAKVTEPIEVTYNWCSTAVEIDGDLYPAIVADPPGESFWVLPGNAKPNSTDKGSPNGGDLSVPNGTGPDKLILNNANQPNKVYTYCFAVKVGIDGGQWLVADPKIVNTGTSRLYSYQSPNQAN
ncbi:hypothetical protein [Qipengyuania soli]|uniref:Uncharacterized protein n=1 Tax=Qipengyuania soli TaxID=2782568 RepID=A0A7S8IUF5_9SPHN|nr:hypothetical protein [Qipengyuania soli]QPC98959.1 hypothetical protein IRL76_14195 [Qipengyuania soli]